MKRSVKAVLILAVTAVTVTGAAGCGIFGEDDIGRDAALEVALEDAGVSESDTTRLKVSEDRDDGRTVYEIQFDADGREYDYEVQASDGRILSADIELLTDAVQGSTSGNNAQNNTANGQADNSTVQGQQNNTGTNNEGTNSSGTNNTGTGTANGSGGANVAVSVEEATSIALERVPGATNSDIRIKLDYDDGIYKYEGDIIYNQREYDFEIDANTGTILEWSEERA